MIDVELKDLIRKAYKAGRRNALKQDEANLNDFINKHKSKLKLFTIPDVSGSTPECECRTEWLSHSTEYNVHPYGNNIEYDKCKKCGKIHNFKTF